MNIVQSFVAALQQMFPNREFIPDHFPEVAATHHETLRTIRRLLDTVIRSEKWLELLQEQEALHYGVTPTAAILSLPSDRLNAVCLGGLAALKDDEILLLSFDMKSLWHLHDVIFGEEEENQGDFPPKKPGPKTNVGKVILASIIDATLRKALHGEIPVPVKSSRNLIDAVAAYLWKGGKLPKLIRKPFYKTAAKQFRQLARQLAEKELVASSADALHCEPMVGLTETLNNQGNHTIFGGSASDAIQREIGWKRLRKVDPETADILAYHWYAGRTDEEIVELLDFTKSAQDIRALWIIAEARVNQLTVLASQPV
jgi:hypothetical protein